MKSESLLEIRDLLVRFHTYEGMVQAVAGVSLDVLLGETLGLVGETGSGKTVTALAVLGIVPPPGKVEGGRICFRRKQGVVELFPRDNGVLKELRGKEIAMAFQEPGSALNPVYRIGYQIAEVLLQHRQEELGRLAGRRRILRQSAAIKRAARELVIDLLARMDIPDPRRVADSYPHELSGGMKQRAVIAMAVACNPRLLLADEPTTAVDVTVQAQILDILRRLKKETGSAIVYITHNMGVVAEMCDRVAVMYAGTIAEVAPVKDIFLNPLHPYTQALLEALPRPGKSFQPIPGTVPNLLSPPLGCRFHSRCPRGHETCAHQLPELTEVGPQHQLACHIF